MKCSMCKKNMKKCSDSIISKVRDLQNAHATFQYNSAISDVLEILESEGSE